MNSALTTLTGYELQRAGGRRPSPQAGRQQGGAQTRAGGGAPAAATRQPGKKPGSAKRAGAAAPKTVAGGWEMYAHRRRTKHRVGDKWSKPRKIGLDVDPEEVVPHLDREVFSPFLGTCDVLLEIGPGAGRFTEILLPKCRRLIAVDTSRTMLRLLRERFGETEQLEYLHSDGRSLEGVADDSVDAAFSYGVFVHLQHWDIFNYLLELQRVLKPGGRALIQHSNTFSELGWRTFRREVPRQLNRHKMHTSFIVNSPELMREFVTRAGLECTDTLTDVVKRDCITLIRKPD